MSASAHLPESLSRFSSAELDMLAKTADALSAYLGKPVLAEVGVTEDAMEWVTFGIPLDAQDEDDEQAIHEQMGGAQARLLGNRGGLALEDESVYDCVYLWAVEISGAEGERFVKLDQDGEASAWSDSLVDVLPFALVDDPALLEDNEDDDDEDDSDEPPTLIHPPSPHRH